MVGDSFALPLRAFREVSAAVIAQLPTH